MAGGGRDLRDLAAILLAISGYSGYSIVVTAVGLAAAINLL